MAGFSPTIHDFALLQRKFRRNEHENTAFVGNSQKAVTKIWDVQSKDAGLTMRPRASE
jgi:hypothetical protein